MKMFNRINKFDIIYLYCLNDTMLQTNMYLTICRKSYTLIL